ncbi:septum site-determining protein MinC [Sulfoacidibacillus thermotolerans]|uniref:Probable septum site-determining protein MinC n=1 Tax=Sulfoacidibacillus thermotolerans TaxID=1765684 RepID=A0A2U3DC11_SULT2|nr:septum site-determining protein MinC [Sulfoacidibacillus thermotolerans]PWI58823.1 septum site-determining protein MinC [Sulfoacidibacillus thermotolerans]
MTKSAKSISSIGSRELVTIKGIRSGLLFVLADDALFADVVEELKQKLTGSHQHLLSGATVNVYIECGMRELSSEEQEILREVFATHENLVLDGFDGPPPMREMGVKAPYVFKGTLRSGQLIEHDGDVIVIGDVNPGAQIIASGDIFVMGHLRGSAHAGAAGDVRAVVAAAYFEPLQVRIAQVVRRSPEAYDRPAEMEFAYLEGEQMAVEKMAVFTYHRQRRNRSRAVI